MNTTATLARPALTPDHARVLNAALSLARPGGSIATIDLAAACGRMHSGRLQVILADLRRWGLWRWDTQCGRRGTTDPKEIAANHARARCAIRAELAEAGCRWDDRDDGGRGRMPASRWRAPRIGPTNRAETAGEACRQYVAEWRRATRKGVA